MFTPEHLELGSDFRRLGGVHARHQSVPLKASVPWSGGGAVPNPSRWRRTRHPPAVARVDAATRPRGTRADARASAARRAAAGASPHDESATGEERRDATGTTRAAAANAPHDDARIETMRMPAARTDDTRGGWTGARRRASPKCGAPQKAPPTIASSHQDDRPTATTRVRVTRGCSARVGLDCHAICTIQK